MTSLLRPVKVSTVVGDRVAFVIAGPSGTGKSTLLARMQETGPLLLLATLEREINSWLYRQQDVDHMLFSDPNWKPMGNPANFEAEGFVNFLRVIEELRDDDKYDNVAGDSGTELAELAWHQAMSPHRAGTPAEMEDKRSRWLPYEQLDGYLDQAVKGLVSLTNARTCHRPKNVGISWHVQPPKDDTIETVGEGQNRTTVKKESADNAGAGVEYEGTVLPMVRGRFRRRLQSLIPTFVYTDVQFAPRKGSGLSVVNQGLEVLYRIQVRPDMDRHTKVPGPLPEVSYITADSFQTFLNLVKGGVKAEAAAKQVAPPSRLSGK